jgi:hypothetical protein
LELLNNTKNIRRDSLGNDFIFWLLGRVAERTSSTPSTLVVFQRTNSSHRDFRNHRRKPSSLSGDLGGIIENRAIMNML